MKTKYIMVPKDIFSKYEIMTAVLQDFESDWNPIARIECPVCIYSADRLLVSAIGKL